MALKVEFEGFLRDVRIWYPLDWYELAENGVTLPLFVFLSDGRGAETLARDVGLEQFVRRTATDTDSINPDGTRIVALVLEPADVRGLDPPDVIDPAADPTASGVNPNREWSTGLTSAGGPLQTHAFDDATYVVSRIQAVIAGFEHALAQHPTLSGAKGLVDLDRVFLVGLHSGATLGFKLLAESGRLVASGGGPVGPGDEDRPPEAPARPHVAPRFAGACVLGGTFGGKPLRDDAGLFPGAAAVDFWPPNAQFHLASFRILSILSDPATRSDFEEAMVGQLTDSWSTPLVFAADSVAELERAGLEVFPSLVAQIPLPPQGLPAGNPLPGGGIVPVGGGNAAAALPPSSDLVRLERTHGSALHLWAAYIARLPVGVQAYRPRPTDVTLGAEIATSKLVARGYVSAAGDVPVVAFRSLEGLPTGVWPLTLPQSNAPTGHTGVSWEGLPEVVKFLLA